jgi:hypothetical protein
VLKRVKVSSNYGDIIIDRFKDIALIVLESVEGKPWLSGWAYRKKITIAGSAGAGTNYQVLLKVGESSGATGYDFHLEGLSAKFPSRKNDGGDLRFTASDGTTLQDFWVESVSGTSPNRVAYVWVEVSADLGSNQSIYCYYGNSAATNASNLKNTFLVEPYDFEVDESSEWTVVNGTWVWDTTNEVLKVTSTDGLIYCTSPIRGLEKYITRFKISATNRAFGIIFGYQDSNNFYHVRFFEGYLDLYKWVGGTATQLAHISYSISPDTWYQLMIKWISASQIKVYVNGVEEINQTTGLESWTSGKFGFREGSGISGTDYLDWVFVRKYVSPEPAFSSAGSEEKRN